MSAYDDYGARLQHSVDRFLAVADEVDVDVGLDGRVIGESAEAALREGQRNGRPVEREWVGNHFEHEKADSRGEAVGKVRGGFKGFESLRDRCVEDNHFERSVLGYDRSGVRGHNSSVSGRA